MGEGTNRVDEPTVDQLAERVERSRARLDTLVAELDQRRHLGMRFRRGLAQHRVWLAAGALVLLAAAGGSITVLVRQRQKQDTLRARLGRYSRALGRAWRDPERVARPQPDLGRKVLAAAATSVTALLVKRVGSKILAGRSRSV